MSGRSTVWVGIGLLLVLGAWMMCTRQREVHAVDGVSALYTGTLQTPIVGLQLTGATVSILVRELKGAIELKPSWKSVALAENATFSTDWKQVFRTRLTDAETIVILPSNSEVQLAGENTLALDSAGNTWVAAAEIPRESDLFEVRIRGPQGEPLADLVVPGLVWVEVAATGARVALGSIDGVEVLDRSGTSVARLPGRAELGALSDDGSWLALERLDGPSPRLELIRVQSGGGSRQSFDVAEGDGISFAPGGRQCVHVARDEVRVFRLEGAEFVQAPERAPSKGFVWRDAAFDASGRLALSRIRIDQPPRRDADDAAHPFRMGAARVAVDFLGAEGRGPAQSREWEVELWNAAAPDLAFDARGRCYALVWPSAYKVEPTWPR